MNSRNTLTLALAGFAFTVQAQTCNPNIRASAPDARYVVNAVKGTVLDRVTGLTWKRCVEGLSGSDCGVGSPILMNWSDALSQAAASSFAGFKDWRIPNSKELESLVEVACYAPAINAKVFPNDPSSSAWASSPDASARYNTAWYVNFLGGDSRSLGREYGNHSLRLVRGGQ